MQLKRYLRGPFIVFGLMALLLLGCVLASARAYSVLNRTFPASIAYDGGEVAGEMTVYQGYRIKNIAQGCGRYYEISFGGMRGVLRPEIRIFIHVREGDGELDLPWVDVHEGEDIVLPNPCTLVPEAIGRVISVRPEVEPLSCKYDYTKYLPNRYVAGTANQQDTAVEYHEGRSFRLSGLSLD
jgi:hypothetical protein